MASKPTVERSIRSSGALAAVALLPGVVRNYLAFFGVWGNWLPAWFGARSVERLNAGSSPVTPTIHCSLMYWQVKECGKKETR